MQEINLYELLKHYTKYVIFIVVFSLLGLLAGLYYTNKVQVPMYKSNATLILIQPATSTAQPTIINNYLELIKSRRVLEPVIKQVGINQSYEQFVGSVSTTSDKDTEVMKLSIATTSKSESHDAMQATIASFKTEIKRLYNDNTVQVVDPASMPDQAYNVRPALQLILATMVGFITAIIAVFFIFDFKQNSKSKKKGTVIDDRTVVKRVKIIALAIGHFFKNIYVEHSTPAAKPKAKPAAKRKTTKTTKKK